MNHEWMQVLQLECYRDEMHMGPGKEETEGTEKKKKKDVSRRRKWNWRKQFAARQINGQQYCRVQTCVWWWTFWVMAEYKLSSLTRSRSVRQNRSEERGGERGSCERENKWQNSEREDFAKIYWGNVSDKRRLYSSAVDIHSFKICLKIRADFCGG